VCFLNPKIILLVIQWMSNSAGYVSVFCVNDKGYFSHRDLIRVFFLDKKRLFWPGDPRRNGRD
jgi:hypothetical protein